MKASVVVMKLADLASQGVYKNVTRQGAKNMNETFEDAADLINFLEKAEKDEEEQALQEVAAILLDNEEEESNESI
jgi:hypothetical protein